VSAFIKPVDDAWVPISHNENRQYLEFFKKFVYSYRFPGMLLYGAIDEFMECRHGGRYHDRCVLLAKKMLKDIIQGKSFYKANKELFTKSEAHHFLNSVSDRFTEEAFCALIFAAKCKARNISACLTSHIVKVFPDKFGDIIVLLEQERLKFIDNYIDFLARFQSYNWTRNDLADISDFVIDKMREDITFSFSGRTPQSIIALSNEWHREISQQKLVQQDVEWKPYNIHDGKFVVKDPGDDRIRWHYRVTQLLSAKALHIEGRMMHHCVGSYTARASKGFCAIFNISRVREREWNPDNIAGLPVESMATVEVSKDTVRQAAARSNKAIDSLTSKVLALWVKENRLRWRP
jgi:hypothetical protein